MAEIETYFHAGPGYEPFLVREGYLARTPRGRVALAPAYAHLGRDRPRGGQNPLF